MNSTLIPGGLLIVIEGIDGAGKTTLANSLATRLRAECGVEVVASKEPTHGPWGTQLRATAQTGRLSPEEELRLLVLDRQQHVAELIAPALAGGKIVILDRYLYSNIAYQGAEGLPPGEAVRANAFAPAADLVLYLDVPVAVGLGRIRARGDVANRFETADNLERVRRLFDAHLPPPPVGVTIDGTQSADTVLADAMKAFVRAVALKIDAAEPEPLQAAASMRAVLYGARAAG